MNAEALDWAVRTYREGTTKKMVADAAGISPGALADLASGRRRASDELAETISDFVGLPPAVLFPEFGPFIEDPEQVVER